MLGALSALLASACWGAGDFLAAVQSRRLRALVVVFWAFVLGGVVAWVGLGIAAAAGVVELAPRPLLVGSVAGVLGALGLVMFFRAMALAPMGLVAPITASGVAIPVAVSLVRGDEVAPLALAGLAIALAGIVVVSLAEAAPDAIGIGGADTRVTGRALALAITAAVLFAAFQLVLDLAGDDDVGDAIVASAGVRVGGIVILAAVIGVRRLAWRVPRASLLPIGASGVLDTAANAAFAIAAAIAPLAIASVLGTLFPAVTALLAWAFLGERLAPLQRLGAAVVVGGVLLVVAGA